MTDKEKIVKIGTTISAASKAVMIIEMLHKEDLNAEALLSLIYKVFGDTLEIINHD